MNDFEIELRVSGVFPKELWSQLTKDIKLVKEHTYEKKDFGGLQMPNQETSVIVTVEAKNDEDAVSLAMKKLNQFLDFYSASTLNHKHIINYDENPIIITNLTGDRTPIHHYYIPYKDSFPFDTQLFSEIIFPNYKITTQEGNEYLKISSDYLRRARFEEKVENIILNLFVCLEALFSMKGENTEIAFKISNRIATLLGENNAERLNIRKNIKTLYNTRSRIIHGDPIELEESAFGNMFLLARESIFRFITLSKKYPDHNTILDIIDDAMIDNSTREQIRKESSEALEQVEELKKRQKVHKKSSEST